MLNNFPNKVMVLFIFFLVFKKKFGYLVPEEKNWKWKTGKFKKCFIDLSIIFTDGNFYIMPSVGKISATISWSKKFQSLKWQSNKENVLEQAYKGSIKVRWAFLSFNSLIGAKPQNICHFDSFNSIGISMKEKLMNMGKINKNKA